MDRRAFLLAGVGVVAAACSGGGTEPKAQPSGTLPSPTSTTTLPPGPPDWPALRSKVSGGLLLPGDADFDTTYRGFNSLRDSRKPAAVALCKKNEDVQACVAVARGSKIPIAARSGGHSYAGYSTPENGLQVDVRAMADVEVRPDGTVRIGAGAKLADVYAALAKAGRCLPAGSCPTVGIAGLTLGGGIGVLSRKFGLTCDRLDAVTVVTADSRVVTATKGADADMFWAMRGGGGGNFGIATEFIFTTEPAPELTVFSLRFPAGSAANVLGEWQQWVTRIPNELWTNMVITGGSPPTCRVGGCFVGSVGALNSLVADLLSRTSARPASRLVQSKGYLDAMRYFAGGGAAPSRESFVASSRMLSGPADDPAALADLVAGKSDMDILLDSLGGAVAEPGSAATAFPHRKALASMQIYHKTTPAAADRANAQLDDVRDRLGAMTGATGYVNYIDPAMPDWANAYYGANLDRLKGIAKQYDPDAVFAFPQGIPR
ncbi:FAD-binding oxidoreductase [Actinocrispum wychmicini]|uniref:FAD/FMN-containing dehydrogenase n=1 Tax=Actinocrispum wychmicini TaxID=1213861 RepID=A0A4R2K6J2_9PSEU|nr:FAD-binding oxidoreductase [Actinocrispum wychmicini]TCO65438.1 FAD/FMN-containing dehydrogenase [Actinocrispum wychmicini]